MRSPSDFRTNDFECVETGPHWKSILRENRKCFFTKLKGLISTKQLCIKLFDKLFNAIFLHRFKLVILSNHHHFVGQNKFYTLFFFTSLPTKTTHFSAIIQFFRIEYCTNINHFLSIITSQQKHKHKNSIFWNCVTNKILDRSNFPI